MRALVTGADGFVGRYLCEALAQSGHEVVAAGGPGAAPPSFALDLADDLNVRGIVDLAKADVIFHLAAQTFVPDAIASPLDTYETNVVGTARLLHAVRGARAVTAKNPRIVVVSSAEVYGHHTRADFPLTEEAAVLPANPYAASKAAAEAIALAEARTYDMDVIVTRAFNHIGPGQNDRFVVASFAKQLAAIAAGEERVLSVGNLEAQRDFLDVRDVVAAYVGLIDGGARGEVYNVCSGQAMKIAEVLRRLITAAHIPVEVREDPARMRPSDVPLFYGSNAKLVTACGWQPLISLDRSLREIYDAAVKDRPRD